jgi:hypothetical protein
MMKLNCKVVASLFFDGPVSHEDMPTEIKDIFRLIEPGESTPVAVAGVDLGFEVTANRLPWTRRAAAESHS